MMRCSPMGAAKLVHFRSPTSRQADVLWFEDPDQTIRQQELSPFGRCKPATDCRFLNPDTEKPPFCSKPERTSSPRESCASLPVRPRMLPKAAYSGLAVTSQHARSDRLTRGTCHGYLCNISGPTVEHCRRWHVPRSPTDVTAQSLRRSSKCGQHRRWTG